MSKSKADLILHPIRMRIIQALVPEGNRTTQQLAERLSDVPQATLYRHLNTLLKGGIIHVVEERKVRGTLEKVYGLTTNATNLTPDDMTEKSSEQHMELFMKFVASIIGSYGKYVSQPRYDLLEDGISFRQVQLYLSDEEYKTMLEDIRRRMGEHAGNVPDEGRRLRNIWTIIVPEVLNQHGDEQDGNK